MQKFTKHRRNFDGAAAIAALIKCGWTTEGYRKRNADLVNLTDEDLARHFLMFGLPEDRPYESKSVARVSSEFNIEKVTSGEDQLMLYGWTERDLGTVTGLLVTADDDNFKWEVVDFDNLSYWRDDVARHLGVPVRTTRHGVLLAGRVQKQSLQTAKLYVFTNGRPVLFKGRTERRASARQCYLEAFRLLESVNVHNELVYLLGDAPAFVSQMAAVHETSGKLVESKVTFSEVRGTPLYAICAVVIGNAPMLKAWLMALPDKHDLTKCEVNLFCNGPHEYDQIMHVVKWFADVLSGNIRLHFAPENLGFNGAVNRLVASATTEYVMVTNVDVTYLNFDLERLIALTEKGSTICAARQFNPMGALQHVGLEILVREEMIHGRTFRIADSRLFGRNTISQTDQASEIEVEFFGAACFFGARSLLRKLGPFSPQYLYAYHEDSDLASRARRMGVKLIVTSALDLIHYESSGVSGHLDIPKRFLIAANCVLLMRELHSGSAGLADETVAAGIVTDAAPALAIPKSSRPPKVQPPVTTATRTAAKKVAPKKAVASRSPTKSTVAKGTAAKTIVAKVPKAGSKPRRAARA